MTIKPTYEELLQQVRTLKLALEQHREKEKTLHLQAQILSSIKDTILIVTPGMRTLYANQTAKRVFGDRPEMFTDPCYRYFKNRDTACENCPVLKTIQDGRPHEAVMNSYDRNGEERWCFNAAFPFYDRKGNIIAGIEIITDYTPQKKSETALRKSESTLESVFAVVPVGICIMKNRVYQRANPNWCDSFGYPEESLLGRTTEFLYENREEYERVGGKLYGQLHRDGVASAHTRLKRSDGEFRDVLLITKPLNPKNLEEGTVTVVHDITDRKRMESERRKLEDQLHQSHRMEAIGTLAGGIAHDFNNLLMSIQGRTSMVLADKDSAHPDFEHLKEIERNIESAASLTKQLLSFARGETYEIKPTDLNGLIKKESRMFARARKEVTLIENYDEHLWSVKVNRGQIQQVLLNLYVNAWQAMPGGGSFYIKTQNVTLNENDVKPHQVEPGSYVQVSVTDTGIGMDKATRQRIFDPFFTTKNQGGGTGLGLASAYGIIKGHGGFIHVYSEKNHGSTFNLYLPASEKEVAEEKKPDHEAFRGSETILFVDDEKMIAEVAENWLERLGYNPLIAQNGKEAVRIYEENKDRIDMVILDMIMPDMGGGETFARMKNINSEVKVLLSSGYSLNGQATELLNRGCKGFIQKPFKMKELSKKLRDILDS